jgi:hypothetical protein
MSWWRKLLAPGSDFDGRHGAPRSANGASSMHLFWDAPPGQWVQAEAVLCVRRPPTVPALYFWALQVSFTDTGRHTGGAHLGLQWYPPHPGSTAVNWGGYDHDGGELEGSLSSLPSATSNPNTRDFPWVTDHRYRLTISRADDAPSPPGLTAWRGSLTEVGDSESAGSIDVRDLYVRARYLDSPMVWSELFADCDAPGSEVRWSGLRLVDEGGEPAEIETVRVNYQPVSDGGCLTTDCAVAGDAFTQVSGTDRRSRQGTTLSRS